MEHAEYFWEAFKEQYRVVKPNGYVYMYAPYKERPHHRPDRWRILPDGCRALAKYSGLVLVESYVDTSNYTVGIFQKPC